MEDLTLDYFIKNIREIDSERRYWLVRTMGGSYYQNFVEMGYIAIGFNEITLSDLKQLPNDIDIARDTLKPIIAQKLPNVTNQSYFGSQIVRFYKEIKVDDVVVVPDRLSHRVKFGIVKGEVYEATIAHIDGACQFTKRRKVEWFMERVRYALNPKLQLMLNTRHIITDIDDYANYIDSLANDFYLKDGETNMVLHINTEESVFANDFFVIKDILSLFDDFCHEYSIDCSSNDFAFKVQMQSKGNAQFSTKKIASATVLGLFIIGINGGGIRVKTGNVDLDVSTRGILEHISDYLDREKDRDIKDTIKAKIGKLELSKPEDLEKITNILHEQNSIREHY